MMLTRAFLLLLAMMTGLSAAQAEERLRPAQGSVGISMSNAVRAFAAVEKVAEAPASRRFVGAQGLQTRRPSDIVTPVPVAITAPHSTVFRSDRARE
jgi:hypothetical protein